MLSKEESSWCHPGSSSRKQKIVRREAYDFLVLSFFSQGTFIFMILKPSGALFALLLLWSTVAGAGNRRLGVLILAHGHEETWNRQVRELARQLPYPAVEVAFGMAQRKSIADSVERLNRQDLDGIVVVPLFVSSHSPIVTASAYLLGLRDEAPPELELFNRMLHGLQHPGSDSSAEHTSTDLSPIRSTSPMTMTSALDDHPLLAEILLDRARSISRQPDGETVVLVAHGPTSESDNAKWMENLAVLARSLERDGRYRAVRYLTLMDDAPPAIRDKASARLREVVEDANRRGAALVVPVLLARGGIEAGIHARLGGLRYRMPKNFLLPDPRVARWIQLQVVEAQSRIFNLQPKGVR